MDRALALIDARLPCSAAGLEGGTRARGLTAIGMPLENLATGARLAGAADFRSDRRGRRQCAGRPRLAVRPEQVDAVPAHRRRRRRRRSTFTAWPRSTDRAGRWPQKLPGRAAPKLVAETLQLIDGFSWLDERVGLVPL